MKKIIIAFLGFAILQVACVYYFIKKQEKKVVYADAIQLFNGYKFKTEMEQMSQGTLNRLKQELDSVGVLYKTNPTNTEIQQMVMERQQALSQGYAEINKEINQKAWERLNPIINKFGKERGLDLLIGANGMGTVLYASDAMDVTADLIKYANQNYDKGN